MHNFDISEKSPTGSFRYGASLAHPKDTSKCLCMLDIFHQQNTKSLHRNDGKKRKKWVLHAVFKFTPTGQPGLDQFRSLAERKRCVCYFHMHTSILPSFLMCTHWFASAFCSFFVSLIHCTLFCLRISSHFDFKCVCYLLGSVGIVSFFC